MQIKITKVDKHYKRLRNSIFPFRNQCPKCCVQAKNANYVKFYKNLSSLDLHISREHKGEPWTNDFKIAITQLAKVLEEVRP